MYVCLCMCVCMDVYMHVYIIMCIVYVCTSMYMASPPPHTRRPTCVCNESNIIRRIRMMYVLYAVL